MKRPVVITVGEPTGIGPDILLSATRHKFSRPIVAITDKYMLRARADLLGHKAIFPDYNKHHPAPFSILHQPLTVPCIPGTLNPQNSMSVLQALDTAIHGCLQHEFSALVTGPVNKAIIQASGIKFSGHTNYLADKSKVECPVMMFTLENKRLVLVTTHLPLAQVPKRITPQKLISTIQITFHALQTLFHIQAPKLLITGLNPHAGESGTIGQEEITIITPVIKQLCQQGIDLVGPVSADTALLYAEQKNVDVIISLFHDQLLPAFKTLGFGKLVNLTLGLPFVRTSVDHGTALEIAGSGKARASSLIEACKLAITLTETK